MNETAPRNGKSEWPPNWIGLFHALAGKPMEFLMLALLMFALAWFVDREARQREKVFAPLLASCLKELEK